MQVHFETPSSAARDLQDVAVRRVLFVMRRFDWLVARVRVRITDLNGPRGGIDKRCQVELTTTSGKGLFVASSTAADWRRAFETALARAARALLRARQRARHPVRRARVGVHSGFEADAPA